MQDAARVALINKADADDQRNGLDAFVPARHVLHNDALRRQA
jgi:hypothetical protein